MGIQQLQLTKEPRIVQAVFQGNYDEVEELLTKSQVGNVSDVEKRTPLHAAAFRGFAEIADLLITSGGARVNAKDNKWLTPLHRACRSQAEDVVSVLLQHGADENARDKNWQTPAHIAAANNSVRCMELLIPKMNTVNITDRLGRSCLHLASYFGHYEMVEHLLAVGGASVNACDKRDRRPLHCAAYRGYEAVVRLLLQHGAEVDPKEKEGNTPLHVACASENPRNALLVVQTLMDADADITASNNAKNSPIHIACLNGNPLILDFLQNQMEDEDFDVSDIVNVHHQSPLHIAAAASTSDECLEILLKKLKNPEAINARTKDLKTPLHLTALRGRFSRAQLLLDRGAEVDPIDSQAQSPLHLACKNAHEDIVELLLNAGANPNLEDREGRSPLHLSAHVGCTDCCKRLIDTKKVDINKKDRQGMTCLHACAFSGPLPTSCTSRSRRRSHNDQQVTNLGLPSNSLSHSDKRSSECLKLLLSLGANVHLVDNYNRTALHYAAQQFWFQCLFSLVSAEVDVNVQDIDGCTALHLASGEDLEGRCVEFLITNKADSVIKDKKGYNCLHYAASNGNTNAIMHLFEYGSNALLNSPCTKFSNSYLHLAAANGHEDALLVLFSKIRDANMMNSQGMTPLALAAANGHKNVINLLFEKGALVCMPCGSQKQTPLHLAALNGHVETVKLLLENTEDATVIEACDIDGATPLALAVANGHRELAKLLIENCAGLDAADKFGRTPLFRAVTRGFEECVNLLLEKGANFMHKDKLGKTPFHLACISGQKVVLGYLIEKLELPNDVHQFEDIDRLTPLHWAALCGHQGCVKLLVKDSETFPQNGNPFSPIHCAVTENRLACLLILLKKFGSSLVNLCDAKGRTPLHIAAFQNCVECFQVLLDHGSEVNARDITLRTPLMIASFKGHLKIVDILCESGCDVELADSKGNSALHYACLQSHTQVALNLLQKCPAFAPLISLQNQDGQTPLHISAPKGMIDVTEVLLTKGCSVTCPDANGLSPALACAPNDDVATCLAMILHVSLSTPVNSESTRKSICSFGSARTSEGFSSTRLSEAGFKGDATFLVNSSFNTINNNDRFKLKDFMGCNK